MKFVVTAVSTALLLLPGCSKPRSTSGHHDFLFVKGSSTRTDGKVDFVIEYYKKSRIITMICFDRNGDGICDERLRFDGFSYEAAAVDRDTNLDGVYERIVDKFNTAKNGVPQEPMKCESISELLSRDQEK
jgi:hypothetical protein